MPDFGATEALIAGQVVSGLMGADAAENAGSMQAGAADRASAQQRAMFDQTRSDLSPWMSYGRAANVTLADLMGISGGGGAGAIGSPLLRPFSMKDYQESPNYQFNLEQGQKAIEKSAAARKMYYAPQTLQDIAKYSQGVASNEFQNSYNNYNNNMKNIWDRLYQVSGSGQNAAANLGGFGAAAGNSIGNNIMSGSAAQAAGGVGAANAMSGAVGGASNTYLLNQILSKNQGSRFGDDPNFLGDAGASLFRSG